MLKIIAVLLAALFGGEAQVADTNPTPEPVSAETVHVVELFTSQGCPMCPSANALLEEMAGEDADILALAYGVSYWDVYGWQDTFAMPEFGDRQQDYVDVGEARRVYTPHFVVNGSPEKLRFRPDRIRNAVQGADVLPTLITAERVDGRIEVRLDGEARETPAQIWAVAYNAGRETVTPTEGPNAGREVSHFNMVRAIEFADDWAGGEMALSLDAPDEALSVAILVQDGKGGRILTAARVGSP